MLLCFSGLYVLWFYVFWGWGGVWRLRTVGPCLGGAPPPIRLARGWSGRASGRCAFPHVVAGGSLLLRSVSLRVGACRCLGRSLRMPLVSLVGAVFLGGGPGCGELRLAGWGPVT